MAGIVGVHGIAQQFGGGYQLGAAWFTAIRDGLAAAGHAKSAEALASDDVRVAFYGDLFRPPGAMTVADPPFSAADIESGPERDLLAAWYQAAVARDPALGVPAAAMGRGTVAVRIMLDRLARSATLAGISQRAFIGSLKQVTAFLTEPKVKQDVLIRMRDRVSDDTRVVIGHSLGSVVAYEYLCRERPGSAELLLTLGSPLGIPNLVFDKLTPTPLGGVGAWPGTVGTWVNIADPDDLVALRTDLAPLFPGAVPGRAVVDHLVDNGDKPHAAERYLSSRQTGSALADVLG
jgi:hypothetical protein